MIWRRERSLALARNQTIILTMLENGSHKKLKYEVWPSPRVVRLLLKVNWVLLSEESWSGAPPVHIPLLG
jgi:hypothetical protein